jgi:hypothetical protein
VGFVHGVLLWSLFTLAEWHPEYGVKDASIAILAIAVVGAIVAATHVFLASLVVLILRRFRPDATGGRSSARRRA